MRTPEDSATPLLPTALSGEGGGPMAQSVALDTLSQAILLALR